jgi:adenosylcobinamide-GDP ribazoletransferase
MIKNHMAGFKIAFSMMTILPLFRLHEFKTGCNGYAVAYYPIVGLFLGAVICAIYAPLHGILPENFLRVSLFALFVLLYGGLHLDGFVDTIDGLFAPKERALDAMKEPTIGAMGAIFGFLFLAVKISAFLSLKDFYLFLLVPMLSRFGVAVAIYSFSYIRPNGMGALAKQEFSAPLFAYSAILVCSIISLVDMRFFALFGIVVVKAFAVSNFLKTRFGGLSGDMYGFVIEVCELALLVALVIWESIA